MRSMRTDSASSARHRSSPRLVILEYFTPGFRFEFECRHDGARVNLVDSADHLEFARFLFYEPGSFPQFVFVDARLRRQVRAAEM